MKTFIKELNLDYVDTGWGNGYVVIPKDHKLAGVDYDDIDVDIHGGLTFATIAKDIRNWKELPDDCDDNDWVVGFDCAHFNDNLITCSKSYVESEVESLREQLLKL